MGSDNAYGYSVAPSLGFPAFHAAGVRTSHSNAGALGPVWDVAYDPHEELQGIHDLAARGRVGLSGC